MIHLQGLQAHEILLFTTPSVVNQANVQADRLRAVCPSVKVASMEVEPQYGWPVNPNMQWNACVTFLEKINHRAGWLWMEIDCVPVQREWANLLANEYMSKGRPFCGRVVDTPYRNAQGEIMPTPSGDTMMMGCAIYPPHMPRDEQIAPLFRDVGKAPPRNAEQPWDIYLRWVMKKRGVAHSELIADMWNTGNYRREGGVIVCDPAPVADKYRGRAVGGVVPANAVMVHGCKDRSLYELVLAGGEAKAIPVSPSRSPTAAEILDIAGNLPKYCHQVEVAKNYIEAVESQQAAATPLDAIAGAAPVVEESPTLPIAINADLLQFTIKAALKKGAVKLTAIAEELQCSVSDIKPMLEEVGYCTKGPGWLSPVKKARKASPPSSSTQEDQPTAPDPQASPQVECDTLP